MPAQSQVWLGLKLCFPIKKKSRGKYLEDEGRNLKGKKINGWKDFAWLDKMGVTTFSFQTNYLVHLTSLKTKVIKSAFAEFSLG